MVGEADSARQPTRHRSRLVRVSLVLGVVALGLLLSRAPLTGYLDARAKLAVKQQQVQVLTQRTQALKKDIESLKDPATMESLARTELSYARPGEQVTIIHGVPRPKPAATKPQPHPGPLETIVTSIRSLF